jgi:hypothetical protein
LGGVDGAHDALGAEAGGQRGDEGRVTHGGTVHGDLVCAGHEKAVSVGQGRDAAADGERHTQGLTNALDDLHGRLALLICIVVA